MSPCQWRGWGCHVLRSFDRSHSMGHHPLASIANLDALLIRSASKNSSYSGIRWLIKSSCVDIRYDRWKVLFVVLVIFFLHFELVFVILYVVRVRQFRIFALVMHPEVGIGWCWVNFTLFKFAVTCVTCTMIILRAGLGEGRESVVRWFVTPFTGLRANAIFSWSRGSYVIFRRMWRIWMKFIFARPFACLVCAERSLRLLFGRLCKAEVALGSILFLFLRPMPYVMELFRSLINHHGNEFNM